MSISTDVTNRKTKNHKSVTIYRTDSTSRICMYHMLVAINEKEIKFANDICFIAITVAIPWAGRWGRDLSVSGWGAAWVVLVTDGGM